MTISKKKLASNRRNLAIGRVKAVETWHKIKERNQQKHLMSFKCEHCGVSFNKELTTLDIEKKRFPRFCSRSCANSRQKPLELREQLSAKLKNKKGVNGKLTDVIAKHCKNCGATIDSQNHTRHYCSEACRIAYRTKCKNLKYEESYQNYRCACGFTFSLSSFPDEFDFELIRKHGWYDPKKNPNGVSRDHLYSVNAGFKNKVPSLLLGHPANCKLVLHKKNQSKGASCSITLTELKERISQWEKRYGKYIPNIWANPNQ